MRLATLRALTLTTMIVACASVAGIAEDWVGPTQPDYDWKNNAGTVAPPDGRSFPFLNRQLPLVIDGVTAGPDNVFQDQQAYDMFAWQVFIALNWPTSAGGPDYGQPADNLSIGQGPDNDRVWESFIDPGKIFKSDGSEPDPYPTQPESRVLAPTKRTHLVNEADEAFFNLEKPMPPIVDLNGNYARYEIRVNRTEYDFIKHEKLYNKAGQNASKYVKEGITLQFPAGCIELKLAWKKLVVRDNDNAGEGVFYDDPNRFYTRRVDILEPFAPGKPTRKDQLYGLVGMHIMYLAQQRTGASDAGADAIHEWVWPTFEHVDNAPLADLREDIGKPQKMVTGAWGYTRSGNQRKWERQPLKQRYNFFDQYPPNAGSLMSSIGGFSPASRARMLSVNNYFSMLGNYYQSKDGTIKLPARLPSQITKVITNNNAVVASKWTHALNEHMQKELGGTVWANYRLVTTQHATEPGLYQKWKATHAQSAAPPSATIIAGNPAPVSVGNAVAETYMQINGSCMNCHSGATFGGPDGKSAYANFSFMLQRAK